MKKMQFLALCIVMSGSNYIAACCCPFFKSPQQKAIADLKEQLSADIATAINDIQRRLKQDPLDQNCAKYQLHATQLEALRNQLKTTKKLSEADIRALGKTFAIREKDFYNDLDDLDDTVLDPRPDYRA